MSKWKFLERRAKADESESPPRIHTSPSPDKTLSQPTLLPSHIFQPASIHYSNKDLSLQTQDPSPRFARYNDHHHCNPPCRAIIQISSCVANNLASPSAASATSATASVPSATATYVPPRSCASATSAPSATTRTSVLYAVARYVFPLSHS
jgi:hypothetical protein